MSLFEEKNLTKWIVILPIVSVIITAIIFVSTGIKNKTDSLKKEIITEQITLVKEHKQKAYEQVRRLVSFLKDMEELQKNQAREDVKNMVHLSLAMIKHIYKTNKNLSDEKILEEVKSNLRDIRFWDGTGYFFIHTLDGKSVLLPPFPSLENKSSINWKDAKNTFIIQKAIRISKSKGEDFIDWYWYKPNEKIMKRKIGYLATYKPLNIYIGTAVYEEDIVNNIKTKIINIIEKEENLYIYKGNGDSIIKNHKNIPAKVLSTIKKGSKIVKDGFFINNTTSSDFTIDNEIKEGTLFVTYLPTFDWIVVANTYDKKAQKNLQDKKDNMKSAYVKLIKNRIFYGFILLLIVLLVTLLFSNKLKQVFKKHQKDLINQHNLTLREKEKLRHNLKHDYLTSLPNRMLFTDRLRQSIKHSIRDKKKIAVIFIDIDKFKSINDSLGHDMGDLLLVEVANRIKDAVRDSDTVARFGGDEFVILIDEFKNLHDIISITDKIQKSLLNPIELGSTANYITLSMGISVFPNDGDSDEVLIKNADIAMYKAKSEGRDRYRFFTTEMNEEIQKQIKIEQALHVAVENREFVLHYQPLVQAKTGEIVGVEALLRWNHPTKGLVFPDEFIGIAEESSVIVELGKWVVEEAMSQMSEWKAKGYKLKKMAINIATKQLEKTDFVECIKRTLERTSCKAEWIEVEIVERTAMKNISKSIEVLTELRKMDVEIAIDDFGTGHSSLAYLKNFPITKLKIDRVFVKNILNSYEDKAIAESIIALGSGLRLKVLAEGVEKEEEREFFAYNGCDEIQGYLFSKPLPANEVEILLKKGSF